LHHAQPSRTAFSVAIRRAAHQLRDHPKVFDDPLALRIIGTEAATRLEGRRFPARKLGIPARRAFLAARSRFAEDELAKAVQNGTRQYVVLGAGLDTFAYRNPFATAGLRVFEVDHPATQAWKRDRLAAGGITVPPEMVFVPVDFERQILPDALRSAGFDLSEKAFFCWLGVVFYLTPAAFAETAGFIASMPQGSGVAFDYLVARTSLGLKERFMLDALSSRVALAGEPFHLFFEPDNLTRQLRQIGFRQIEDLGSVEINSRYFDHRADGLRIAGGLGRLVSARS
jgi:methyltransferase (TIGR00027 family)